VEAGQWGFDAQGRLVGFYTDVSGYSVCVTNQVLINTGIGIVTNFVVECNRLTNAISFVGSVVPGKHLTLNATTPDGHSTYSGVPVATNLPDLSGQWSGVKTDNPLTFNEFFSLLPNTTVNNYNISGMGPGYIYQGVAFLSKSGKFAVAALINPPPGASDSSTDVTVRSVMGSLNKQKFTFSTTGLEQPSGQDEPRIKFTGSRISP
jgi:hypothetical protein